MSEEGKKYWKEAETYDKIRQQKGFKPMAETDLILTALHFEICDNEAMAAVARDMQKREGQ